MTIVEATQHLLEFFAEKDCLKTPHDLYRISKLPEDEAALRLALEELATQKFVIKKDLNNEEYYVLYTPLSLHVQNLGISLATALDLAKLLNGHISKESQKVNPLRVSEQDIINLLMLVNSLKQN